MLSTVVAACGDGGDSDGSDVSSGDDASGVSSATTGDSTAPAGLPVTATTSAPSTSPSSGSSDDSIPPPTSGRGEDDGGGRNTPPPVLDRVDIAPVLAADVMMKRPGEGIGQIVGNQFPMGSEASHRLHVTADVSDTGIVGNPPDSQNVDIVFDFRTRVVDVDQGVATVQYLFDSLSVQPPSAAKRDVRRWLRRPYVEQYDTDGVLVGRSLLPDDNVRIAAYGPVRGLFELAQIHVPGVPLANGATWELTDEFTPDDYMPKAPEATSTYAFDGIRGGRHQITRRLHAKYADGYEWADWTGELDGEIRLGVDPANAMLVTASGSYTNVADFTGTVLGGSWTTRARIELELTSRVTGSG